MKKIIFSRQLIDQDTTASPSDPDSAPIIEIEDEDFGCGGCAAEDILTGLELSEDFIWHPKKKF